MFRNYEYYSQLVTNGHKCQKNRVRITQWDLKTQCPQATPWANYRGVWAWAPTAAVFVTPRCSCSAELDNLRGRPLRCNGEPCLSLPPACVLLFIYLFIYLLTYLLTYCVTSSSLFLLMRQSTFHPAPALITPCIPGEDCKPLSVQSPLIHERLRVQGEARLDLHRELQ